MPLFDDEDDLYESCRPGGEYALLRAKGSVSRVRFERLEEWRSMNPKALDKRRWRVHLVEIRRDGSEVALALSHGPKRMLAWSNWEHAWRAIAQLHVQAQMRQGFLDEQPYWRLEQEHMAEVARAIDAVGLEHPSVAGLGWPLRSRRDLRGRTYWRFGLRHLVAVSRILDAPKRPSL